MPYFSSTVSLLILLRVLCTCISVARSDFDTTLLWFDCGDSGNFSSITPFSINVQPLLLSLPFHASSTLYYTNSTGTFTATVYAMFQCRGDKTFADCSACVSLAIIQSFQVCPTSFVSRVLLGDCTLMYQNTPILVNSFTTEHFVRSPDKDTSSTFQSNRDTALQTVCKAAPSSHGFYSATSVGNNGTDRVYALAQCSGYLSQSDCSGCISKIRNSSYQSYIGNASGGRACYGSSCYFQFDIHSFYAETQVSAPSPKMKPAPATPSKGGSVRKPVLIGSIAGSCLLVAVLCILFGFWKGKKRRSTLNGQSSLELQPDLMQHQVRLFSLEELKKATRNFDDENKLGEGGFGSVYQGLLENGQFVAIKKLSHPSHHGERQFLSEVKLLTSVQHRNLIILIGCCIDGSQRLLIYEYLRNQSLDRHLFYAERSVNLNWSIRRHIIIGTAKGLAYLHEDSQVRIVHRDIKAANILLDDNLHPKIADFGLARLFGVEQTHVTTRVAGTLGYLAPEYAINGKLTEKADTFSYGLVVLEILSGRRNIDTGLPADLHQLLQWTWELYKEHRQLELIDPLLKDHYSAEEANRMVQVALLCTQSVAGLRPAMSKVVTLLTGEAEILDAPTHPPFVQNSIAGLESEAASRRDQPGSDIHCESPSTANYVNFVSVYTQIMP